MVISPKNNFRIKKHLRFPLIVQDTKCGCHSRSKGHLFMKNKSTFQPFRCINHPMILFVFVGQLLHGYGVTAVAWLYWERYVSSLFQKKRSSEEEADAKSGNNSSSLKKLLGFMRPYTSRFVFVMLLVTLSSYGMWMCVSGDEVLICTSIWKVLVLNVFVIVLRTWSSYFI